MSIVQWLPQKRECTVFRWLICSLWLVGLSGPALAFDMAGTMQVGGWQEREEITTNAKGKVTEVNIIWVGIVGSKVVDGVEHIWMEMRNQTYKQNRKGERKAKGNAVVVKSLVEKSALGDMTNPAMQLRKFGKEIIMQSGSEPPMRISGGGAMANMALQAMGAEMDFEFKNVGQTDAVTVPGGEFSAAKFVGSGTMQMKMLVRTIKVQTQVESWMHEAVPMAVVQQKVKNVTNGKESFIESKLLAYGQGAKSQINDAEVQDMPTFQLPFGKG